MKSQKQNHKGGFFSIVIFMISFTLFLFTVLEFQMVHSLFISYKFEKEYQKKIQKMSLLEDILQFEKKEMEDFLKKYPQKTLNDYIEKTEEGKRILTSPKYTESQGGYVIEQEVPSKVKQARYKVYYIKNYQIPKFHYHYKIRVLIEYTYKENKQIESFISEKIVEIRIFLE